MIEDELSGGISIAEARQHIKDLFHPQPWIYWCDFLTTYGLGLLCFQKVRGGNLLVPHQGFVGTWSQAFFFVASCLLFYRASIFIHEIVHQRAARRLQLFSFVWNVVCGIPFLIPSFVYFTHIDHHRRRHFGTDKDGEYIPLASMPRWNIVFYLSWSLVIPILAIVRFGLLTPLAWVLPGFRTLVHRHASSMVMDPTYIRPLPTKGTMRLIYVQELGCFLWCLGIAIVPPVLLGRWPIPFLIHAYLMSVCIVLLNSLRTLGSHRWHGEGKSMTFVDQIRDSVNYPKCSLISELWGPVGTRFHALHHLFPSLPYHAMPEAHRRLMDQLPSNSAYRQAQEDSLTAGVVQLWQRSSEHARHAVQQTSAVSTDCDDRHVQPCHTQTTNGPRTAAGHNS